MQSHIITKYRTTLEIICACPQKADFFNKLIEGRNFDDMSVLEAYHALIEIIITSSKINTDSDADSTLKWLKYNDDHVYVPYVPMSELSRYKNQAYV